MILQRRAQRTGIFACLGCLYLLAISGCSKSEESAALEKRPYNVLLVTLDTFRADRMSCYGYSRNTTPNFDRLANESVRFDFAISQAGVTPVSHASILTGLNPYQHGLRVLYAPSGCTLPDTIPTLATVLGEFGLQTAAFLSSFTVSEFYGLDRGFQLFDAGLERSANSQLSETKSGFWGWNIQSAQRRSDVTTTRAIAWLRSVKSPFFAWVHYWDPHDQMVVPPQYVLGQFQPDQPTREGRLEALYDAEVSYVDQQFGLLIDTLKSTGRYENTVIVVVADHGEGLSQGLQDHGWWRHRLLYQEQLHVPLIVHLPGQKAGRVCDELVRTIDVFPTVLEALGIEAPQSVEGLSLAGLMSGKAELRRLAYADQLNLYDLTAKMIEQRPKDDLMYCMMDRTWKLIYRQLRPGESELYNLGDDPRETTNLFQSQPLKAKPFLEELRKRQCFVDKPFGTTDGDSEALDRLKSLGYVGD